MDQPWQLEMLGWLRVVQGDRIVSRFRTRKAGALLAYLAYHAHRSHPREQLIELLWPGSVPAAGRCNLRTELTSLRHQLEVRLHAFAEPRPMLVRQTQEARDDQWRDRIRHSLGQIASSCLNVLVESFGLCLANEWL